MGVHHRRQPGEGVAERRRGRRNPRSWGEASEGVVEAPSDE